MDTHGFARTWTVAEAKARLSEILRLADEQGPQRIGVRRAFVVVSERMWREKAPGREPLGRWLVDNVPRGLNLDIPRERGSRREIPFASDDGE
ncbi:type II toxin-antitoxin system prevent-host-death family antitoxin [Candidatus Palauibacter sp.]|uniref:type II toxin-antitoxin system prevent-host-death family antitoxin n=1 Tax=Candidatus Palauibacter sp. TaxID=3101350 RepID=UPI003B017450